MWIYEPLYIQLFNMALTSMCREIFEDSSKKECMINEGRVVGGMRPIEVLGIFKRRVHMFVSTTSKNLHRL